MMMMMMKKGGKEGKKNSRLRLHGQAPVQRDRVEAVGEPVLDVLVEVDAAGAGGAADSVLVVVAAAVVVVVVAAAVLALLVVVVAVVVVVAAAAVRGPGGVACGAAAVAVGRHPRGHRGVVVLGWRGRVGAPAALVARAG